MKLISKHATQSMRRVHMNEAQSYQLQKHTHIHTRIHQVVR